MEPTRLNLRQPLPIASSNQDAADRPPAGRTVAVRGIIHVVQYTQDTVSSGEWLMPIAALVGTSMIALGVGLGLHGLSGAKAPDRPAAQQTGSAEPNELVAIVRQAGVPFSRRSPLMRFEGAEAIDTDDSDADLISPYGARFAAVADTERNCLARAVYFEARGEPIQGQIAVAQVVLNRAASGRWPSTICKVVNQGIERGSKCQFSFACWASSRGELSGELWDRSRGIAEDVLAGGAWLDEMAPATHYHRHDLRPIWRLALRPIGRIGLHMFYADPPPEAARAARGPQAVKLAPATQAAVAATDTDGAVVAAKARAASARLDVARSAAAVPASQIETGSIALSSAAPTDPATPVKAKALPIVAAPKAATAKPSEWVGKLFPD